MPPGLGAWQFRHWLTGEWATSMIKALGHGFFCHWLKPTIAHVAHQLAVDVRGLANVQFHHITPNRIP